MFLCENFKVFMSLSILFQHQASSVSVNYIIVAGGRNRDGAPISDVQAYRIETGLWIHGDQLEGTQASIFHRFLPEADSDFQLLSTDRSLMKLGGQNEFFHMVNWRSNNPVRRMLPAPNNINNFREGACGVVRNGHAYLIGGRNAEHTISRLQDNSRWIDLSISLQHPLFFCGAAAFRNYIYVCGNYYPQQPSPFMRTNYIPHHQMDARMLQATQCFRYNVHSNQIQPIANMKWPRTGSFLVRHGNYLYAVGGIFGTGAERYDLLREGGGGEWEPIAGSMSYSRRLSMAVSDGFNRIYLTGGMSNYISVSVDGRTEYYDSEKKQWFQTARMPVAVTAAGVLHAAFPDA